MKKSRFFKLLIAGALVASIAACSSDDGGSNGGSTTGGNTSTDNVISFNGSDYKMNAGIVVDYGNIGIDDTPTHYNFDFTVGDTSFVLISSGGSSSYGASANMKVIVYMELFNPDTSNFKVGTFSYLHEDSINVRNITNNYFFTDAYIQFDTNGVVNGALDGEEFEVIGGSVAVSGSGNTNYTLVYNFNVAGGKSITGRYVGPFIYDDQR